MISFRTILVAIVAWLAVNEQVHAEVVTASVDLRDPSRQRTFRVDVAYPTDSTAESRWPVVVVSHAGGGSGDRMRPLLRQLAEAGYVALAPTHEDSAVGSGGGGQRMPGPPTPAGPTLWDSRAKDIVTVLHADWGTLVPPLAGRIDTQQIAIVGHALGAGTALILGGARPVWDKQPPQLPHPGIKAVILLAPPPQQASGTGPQGLTDQSYATLRLPVLIVTEADLRPATTRPTPPNLLPLLPEGDKFLLTLKGPQALSWVGAARPDTGPSDPPPRTSAAEQATSTVMVTFLNAFLRGDPEARDLIVSGSVVASFRDVASLEGR